MENANETTALPLPESFSSPFDLWRYYGVQVCKNAASRSYIFRFFAPDADGVYLVSSFTSWENGKKMTRLSRGIWELTLTVDRSLEGECYKYKVVTKGAIQYCPDPFAKREEGKGGYASIVAAELPSANGALPFCKLRPVTPLHVLEVSLASFYTQSGRLPYEEGAACRYRSLAEKLAIYAKSTGYTHIKLLPRYKDEATSYFAPAPRYGTPEEFAAFVDFLHENGVGVIGAFAYPSSAEDCRLLLSAIDYHLTHYALDGISFEDLPNASRESAIALLQSSALLKARHSGVILLADKVLDGKLSHITAERSSLRENALTALLSTPPARRGTLLKSAIDALLSEGMLASQSKTLTRGGERSLMEELWGSYEQKFAENRLYQLLLMAARGPKLSFMMQSLAPFRPWQDHLLPEWYMADFKLHRAHRRYVRALNAFYLETPLFRDSTLTYSLSHLDLDASVFSLKLLGKAGEAIFVFNCSELLLSEYSLTVDKSAYTERFSSDEESYAGEGYVHRIALSAQNGKLTLDLAPLSAVVLQPLGCDKNCK